jgi:hypothetical protein
MASLWLEITDRGPFVKSREIDLLKELLWTFQQNSGGMKVTIALNN